MTKKRFIEFLYSPFPYFMTLCLLLEAITQFLTVNQLGSYWFLIMCNTFCLSFVFSIPYFFLNEKYQKIYLSLSIVCVCLFYLSQCLYYQFFTTFYSFSSMLNGGVLFGFLKQLMNLLLQNIVIIVIYLLPIVFHFIFVKNKMNYIYMSHNMICYIVMIYTLLCIGSSYIYYFTQTTRESPLELYNEKTMQNLAVSKLGLSTTFQIDFQGLVLGKDSAVSVITPTTTPQTLEKVANTMKIDFDSLIEKETDETIKQMHQYFKNVTPTYQNEYTGMFEGYNVILLTAEGFSPYAIDEELTPTLYKLYNTGFQFTNFYTPLWNVSTSDGEYVAMQGLLPKAGTWSFRDSSSNDLPLTLGKQFSSLGYATYAYHNHSATYYNRDQSHPNLGYVYKAIGRGLTMTKQWPRSDLEMMQKTVDDYIYEDKFHAYYMTVSGHLEYNFLGNTIANNNQDLVSHLDASEPVKAYMACHIELDKALEYLIQRLEDAGKLNNTLIALSADHYPYGLTLDAYSELAGKSIDDKFELYKNSFLIWSGSMKEAIVNNKLGCSADILPTLSNLLGLDYDSRLLMGIDLFSDAESLVIFESKSFLSDNITYYAPTSSVTYKKGENESELNRLSHIVKQRLNMSKLILEKDYYRTLNLHNE